jgi:hypothetical protein
MSNREHPILFNGEMVRAILDGRKTMTRRVVRSPADMMVSWGINSIHEAYRAEITMKGDECGFLCAGDMGYEFVKVPYRAGDMLWVKETFNGTTETGIAYRATEPQMDGAPWRPSIHMPRWASRITLEVTAVKVERVQDITGEDAMAEGVLGHGGDKSRALTEFMVLWNKINESRGYGWSVNPWVFAVAFRRVIG